MKIINSEIINSNSEKKDSFRDRCLIMQNMSVVESATTARKILREDVENFEKELSKIPGAQFGDSDLAPLTHHFAPGVYGREMLIPKGSILVSKIHKTEHLFFLIKGDITIVSEQGGIKRCKAPLIFKSMPGAKRIGFAHDDTICVTIHPTQETDLDKIEDQVIAKSYAELEGHPGSVEEVDGIQKLLMAVTGNFDVDYFRELTVKVIAAEKDGFWSDWTKEQQVAYTDRDWEKFSCLRGYSDAEIKDFREWLGLYQKCSETGVDPAGFIADMAELAYQKNLSKDIRGEIALSSHHPLQFIKKGD